MIGFTTAAAVATACWFWAVEAQPKNVATMATMVSFLIIVLGPGAGVRASGTGSRRLELDFRRKLLQRLDRGEEIRLHRFDLGDDVAGLLVDNNLLLLITRRGTLRSEVGRVLFKRVDHGLGFRDERREVLYECEDCGCVHISGLVFEIFGETYRQRRDE